MIRALACLSVLLLLASCGGAGGGTNPTVFEYQINRELLAEKPIKRVIVASANFSGEPTRHHLQPGARRVHSLIKDYLRRNGYEVAPDHLFDNAWNQAIRTYGEIYDPTTGRVDQRTWQAVMITTAQALQEAGNIDAIIFADVIEHDVQHNSGMQHHARWLGVTRRPALQGPGSGVPADFDWNQSVRAASVVVNVLTVDLEGVFSSRGGLDTLQAIDLRMSSPAFVRRRNLLSSDTHLQEGIELAFHPLIKMRRYPGPRN